MTMTSGFNARAALMAASRPRPRYHLDVGAIGENRAQSESEQWVIVDHQYP